MSTSWNRMKRTLGAAVPTALAVMAIGSGTAKADPITFEGSDTLTEVIRSAITASGMTGVVAYNNIGSGQAEKNMIGTGNFLQSIGPMSRNFVPSVLSAHTSPNWQPTDNNVLALDAGIVGVANISGHCQNITATLADAANPAIAQVTTDLSIILSGYPAGGVGTKSTATTAECAHPQRLAALDRFTACQGVNRIDHIYRRDDKSGTQDTFREHLQMDRWCNGKSEGNNNLGGSNLVNQDLDPIRRPCIGSDTTKAATKCTYYPLTTACTAGAANITYGTETLKCTQGLVVALSENDPGQKDHTLSIAQRIASDLNGFTVGLAGKAIVDLSGAPNVGTNINTVTYEDGNVRAGQYMLSRRLFLQKNPSSTGYVDASHSVDPTRLAAETSFFTWATNKCNLRQIVLDAGFLPPLASCSAACDDPLNITCLASDPGVGTPKQNIGAETTATGTGNAYPCVSNGTVQTTGSCPVIPVLASTYKCNLGAKCTSGTCNLDATLLSGVCQ